MSQDTVSFRLATLNDLQDCIEINIDGDEKYRSRNEIMFQGLTKEEKVLVAIHHQKTAALLYWRDEFLGRSNQWYLKQITVKKSERDNGIGKKLLLFFLDHARQNGVEKVFADIHNDNFSSLKIALHAGALISGTIEGVGNAIYNDQRVIVRFELTKATESR